MQGIVTEYNDICIFCGRQAEAEHVSGEMLSLNLVSLSR